MHLYARVFIVISMLLAGSGTGGSVYGQPYHVQNWVLSIGGILSPVELGSDWGK